MEDKLRPLVWYNKIVKGELAFDCSLLNWFREGQREKFSMHRLICEYLQVDILKDSDEWKEIFLIALGSIRGCLKSALTDNVCKTGEEKINVFNESTVLYVENVTAILSSIKSNEVREFSDDDVANTLQLSCYMDDYYEFKGDYAKQLEILENMLEILRLKYGNETRQDVADVLRSIARVQFSLGKYKKSAEIHQQSIKIIREVHGKDLNHPLFHLN